jgi:hypothetical protein
VKEFYNDIKENEISIDFPALSRSVFDDGAEKTLSQMYLLKGKYLNCFYILLKSELVTFYGTTSEELPEIAHWKFQSEGINLYKPDKFTLDCNNSRLNDREQDSFFIYLAEQVDERIKKQEKIIVSYHRTEIE